MLESNSKVYIQTSQIITYFNKNNAYYKFIIKKEVIILLKKLKQSKLAFIFIFSLVLTASTLVFPKNGINISKKNQIENETDTRTPKTAGYYTESYIYIFNGNWSDCIGKGWFSGNGSYETPYVIQDVIITGNHAGSCILIQNSDNYYFRIENCTTTTSLSGAFQAGIRLANSNNGTLINNNCSYNLGVGITIDSGSKNNKIIGNNISDNQWNGIYMDNCYNNMIIGNRIINSSGSGIYLNGGNNNNRIFDNTIIDYYKENYDNGISITYNSVNNTVMNNNISGCYSGIALSYYANNTIVKNNRIFENGEDGINLIGTMMGNESCYNTTISGNTVYNNGDNGISIRTTRNVTIEGNIIYNNTDHGIFLEYYSINNTISGNLIYDNHKDGIFIYDASRTCCNNTVKGNMIYNNTGRGIYLSTSADGNLVFNNSMINNLAGNGRDIGEFNHWNNSAMGNYWDDYSGQDPDDDGIGETPYTGITGDSSIDYKPLMWDAPNITIDASINNSLFGTQAPEYNLTVLEGRGEYFWIEVIELGLVSTRIVLLHVINENIMGSIETSLWNNIHNGTYTVRFYINDSRGYVDSIDIIINVGKPDTSIPSGGGGNPIPGYDMFVLIGSLFTISLALIYLKKRKTKYIIS